MIGESNIDIFKIFSLTKTKSSLTNSGKQNEKKHQKNSQYVRIEIIIKIVYKKRKKYWISENFLGFEMYKLNSGSFYRNRLCLFRRFSYIFCIRFFLYLFLLLWVCMYMFRSYCVYLLYSSYCYIRRLFYQVNSAQKKNSKTERKLAHYKYVYKRKRIY